MTTIIVYASNTLLTRTTLRLHGANTGFVDGDSALRGHRERRDTLGAAQLVPFKLTGAHNDVSVARRRPVIAALGRGRIPHLIADRGRLGSGRVHCLWGRCSVQVEVLEKRRSESLNEY